MPVGNSGLLGIVTLVVVVVGSTLENCRVSTKLVEDDDDSLLNPSFPMMLMLTYALYGHEGAGGVFFFLRPDQVGESESI